MDWNQPEPHGCSSTGPRETIPTTSPFRISCALSRQKAPRMPTNDTPTFVDFCVSTSLQWNVEEQMLCDIPEEPFGQVFRGTTLGMGGLWIPCERIEEVPILWEYLREVQPSKD